MNNNMFKVNETEIRFEDVIGATDQMIGITFITWDNLRKGDSVRDDDGYEYLVLARTEDLIALSYSTSSFFEEWLSVDYMKSDGYTIKQPIQEEKEHNHYPVSDIPNPHCKACDEKIEEMTLEAVCKELGRTVKIAK